MRIASFRGPFWRYVINFIRADGRPNQLPAMPFWRWKKALATARSLADSKEMEGAIVEIYARVGFSGALEDLPRERFYGRKIQTHKTYAALLAEHGKPCGNKYCGHGHCAQMRQLKKVIDGR